MNGFKKYFLILPLLLGIFSVGTYSADAKSTSYSFACSPNMATKVFDVQINSGDLVGINTSQCFLYLQSGDIGIDPVHPVRDTSCVSDWCTTGGATSTTAFGQAFVELKSSSTDAKPNWIIRVYFFGSSPPPAPGLTQAPSPGDTQSPKPTSTPVIDPIQGQTIGINQTAYSYCGNGKTTSGSNSNGFTAPNKITVKRGDVGEIAISIIGTPRHVVWRFSAVTQVGFNSGAGDFGTLTVSDCKAIYKAPSVTTNPSVSLLVEIHAGVTAASKAPTPSPTPSARCTTCPAIGAPVPAPKPASSTSSTYANGEQGPSAVGWLSDTQIYVPAIPQVVTSQSPTSKTCSPSLSIYISQGAYGIAPIWIDGRFIADNQIYSRWSVGNHRVFITDGNGSVLVDRTYNSTCGLTQIKFN